MKLCFPIALVLLFLLQIIRNSSDDFQMEKNKMFRKIKGFKNIFEFFGEEMDTKAKFVLPPWGTFLKYNEAKPTFLQQPEKTKFKFYVNHKKLEHHIRLEIGEEEPTLVGLDTLLINFCGRDKKTYLSRTGVIKAERGYFILRRNFAINNDRTQYIRLFKILEEDPYIFWKDQIFDQQHSTTFRIVADEDKYYQFYCAAKTRDQNAFHQIKCISSYQAKRKSKKKIIWCYISQKSF